MRVPARRRGALAAHCMQWLALLAAPPVAGRPVAQCARFEEMGVFRQLEDDFDRYRSPSPRMREGEEAGVALPHHLLVAFAAQGRVGTFIRALGSLIVGGDPQKGGDSCPSGPASLLELAGGAARRSSVSPFPAFWLRNTRHAEW